MKPCSVCKVIKPETDYYTKGRRKIDGTVRRDAECIGCRSKRINTINRAKSYKVLIAFSEGLTPKCKCCGEKNPEFLAIHHTNNDGHLERKKLGRLRFRQYLWEGKRKNTKDLAVLCHNCNSSIGSYGYCPHQEKRMIFERAYQTWMKKYLGPPRNWKITQQIARDIKDDIREGMKPVAIAKKYGINVSTVYMIRLGRQWKDA